MNRRQVFYTLVVFVGCTFAAYQYGQLIGRAEERYNVRAALEAMAQQVSLSAEFAKTGLPNELDGHHWVGHMDALVGGLVFNFVRYSRLDEIHREWASMACVDAGRGMEVGGRWKANQWWVSAHDFDHPFPESIRIPVKDVVFSPLAEK